MDEKFLRLTVYFIFQSLTMYVTIMYCSNVEKINIVYHSDHSWEDSVYPVSEILLINELINDLY